jgi:2-polyprenyl-3-methyl-5-hydroxy-6-metoxy-1,4-benzoquinol methylase
MDGRAVRSDPCGKRWQAHCGGLVASSWDPYLFGGSPKHVRRSHRRFIRWFRGQSPVLDVGCGRGLFLQLMRECGIEGLGIDTNLDAVAACRAQGFEACVADALDFLASQRQRFGGVFCSHVVEHLPFEDTRRLFGLCRGALRAGGILVVLTPNSGDLRVMGETFWLDPTHVRPYPIKLLRALAEEAGFEVEETGAFHGALARRQIPGYLLSCARLAPFYGRPNAYIVARHPGA